MTNEPRYSFLARAIHWVVAAGFACMWMLGFTMTRLVEDDSAPEEFLYGVHISLGVTLLALIALRVAVRLTRCPPPLPASLQGAERAGAHLGHAALYALPALVMALGWAEVDLGGHGVAWFGVEMPKVFATVPEGSGAEEWAETLHRWLAYVMLCVAVIHVAAVAKHRWIDGHDVLYRMTFGGGRAKKE